MSGNSISCATLIEIVSPKNRFEQARQPHCDVRILARIRPAVVDRHIAHRKLIPPRSDEVGDRHHAVVQETLRQGVEIVRILGRDEVMRHHRVEERPPYEYPVIRQHQKVVLQILTDLRRFAFEGTGRSISRRCRSESHRAAESARSTTAPPPS
jgi:hypothetical protein